MALRWRAASVLLLAGALFGVAGSQLFDEYRKPIGSGIATGPAAAVDETPADPAVVWAISLVRARPGQRQRLLRFLRANWLTLDQQLLEQGRISRYRLLEADEGDGKGWDYAVILEYRDRQAMADFVPAYLALVRERPQVRIDGLAFADLGEVVQQKIAMPLPEQIE